MKDLRVDEAELATILAALCFYHRNEQGDPERRSIAIHEVATNRDNVMSSLDQDGIAKLCKEIHQGQHYDLESP